MEKMNLFQWGILTWLLTCPLISAETRLLFPETSHSKRIIDPSSAGQDRAKHKRNINLSYVDSQENKAFLNALRKELFHSPQIDSTHTVVQALRDSNFSKEGPGFAVTLYAPDLPTLRAYSFALTLEERLRFVVKSIKKQLSSKWFKIEDTSKVRIQIDFVTADPVNVKATPLSANALGPNRFESGVDGIIINKDKEEKIFLPGDAYTRSFLTVGQILTYLRGKLHGGTLDEYQIRRFETTAYVSYGEGWIRLFRGHPVVKAVSEDLLLQAGIKSSKFLIETQHQDGRFLYYYDAANDSFIDHEHPTRKLENLYYNEVRHSGGALLLLEYYKNTKDDNALTALRKAATFLTRNIKQYTTLSGQPAGYVYYNRKGKLGAAGVGLYFLVEYSVLTGDTSFDHFSMLLKNHIASEVLPSGEFRYYYLYLDKQISEKDNSKYFSFYYPGEAMLSLVNYYGFKADAKEKEELKTTIQKSLKFLLVDRPRLRKEYYTELPSDAWLMMAIDSLWNYPELRSPEYLKAVFQDADKMVSLMYTDKDALYPDYTGAFYYKYGDFPYSDGARAEGLVAALSLANKNRDTAKVKEYRDALWKLAWATFHLINTPESTYFAPKPERAIGGIRFKHTRQWFRVDTIQHVAGFYLKFLKCLKEIENSKT